MRRTSKEIADYCEKLLQSRNDNVSNMCKHIGIPQAKFSMWKQRDFDPRLGTLIDIILYLDISFEDLLDLKPESEKLPDDIFKMVSMLKHIKENDRKMILLNIKNYYDVAMTDKNSDSRCDSK